MWEIGHMLLPPPVKSKSHSNVGDILPSGDRPPWVQLRLVPLDDERWVFGKDVVLPGVLAFSVEFVGRVEYI